MLRAWLVVGSACLLSLCAVRPVCAQTFKDKLKGDVREGMDEAREKRKRAEEREAREREEREQREAREREERAQREAREREEAEKKAAEPKPEPKPDRPKTDNAISIQLGDMVDEAERLAS